MTSPEQDTPLRTDGLFRSQDDQVHHTGTTPAHYAGTTQFTSLIFDKVNLFPLDYMHLVCLGIMRRMRRNWICGRRRLTRAQKQKLSSRLCSCVPRFPQHFQRKPRGVEEHERWKATRIRGFSSLPRASCPEGDSSKRPLETFHCCSCGNKNSHTTNFECSLQCLCKRTSLLCARVWEALWT